MNLNKMFYTPVWTGILDSITAEQLADVHSFCMLARNDSTGKIASNEGGWQSKDYYYQQLEDTPLKLILDLILDNMNSCMRDLGSPASVRFSNIWININQAGNSNKLHSHGGVLSGAFYVTAPVDSGPIYISRAFDLANWFYGCIMSQHNTDASVTEMHLTPSEKMLVLFPSWLPHGVKPHNSEKERISISFNTQLDFPVQRDPRTI
jgi:uncharacterized protein (TIGR02466 family)